MSGLQPMPQRAESSSPPAGGAAASAKPVFVYCGVAFALLLVVTLALAALGVSPADPVGGALVLAAMWIPAVARWVAVRTADRDFVAPFPLRRFGRPRLAVLLGPLALIVAVYAGAYALAAATGVQQAAPAWRGARALAVNVAFNLPLLTAWGLLGGLGEELGWRGYLQPKLDQLRVRGSLVIVILVETLFHVPVFAFAGYLQSSSLLLTVALFFGLKLAWTPLCTWGTYRTRSIWFAALFHALHNALSQTIFPKALGAGSELVLGESGLLPVVCYLVVAALVLGVVLVRSGGWRQVANEALARSPTERAGS